MSEVLARAPGLRVVRVDRDAFGSAFELVFDNHPAWGRRRSVVIAFDEVEIEDGRVHLFAYHRGTKGRVAVDAGSVSLDACLGAVAAWFREHDGRDISRGTAYRGI